MILQNFQKMFASSNGYPDTYPTKMNNTTGHINFNFNMNYVHYTSTANTNGWWVDIGFGDTAPTASDYKLADSNALDNPTLNFVSGTNYRPTGKLIALTGTFQNNTTNAVTVKEVGLCSRNGTQANNVLLVREVLDTPIVMAPGEIRSFTIALDFDPS